MIRAPFILSAIAVAVLAGCASSTESGITSAPAPVAAPAPAAAAPAAPAAPTYSVGATGTTVVVPNAAAAAPVASPKALPLRVGFGRIDSILVMPNAAAGGSGTSPSKRVAMRMDDGTTQHFDTNADDLKIGDRIEITPNGTMRHPA
jgi:hypothetical protein